MHKRPEQQAFKRDVEAEGERAIAYAREHHKKAIVLSGRPYHLDTEINHGIDKMITSYDMVVLSEDAVCHMGKIPRPIRVLDQWAYHSRPVSYTHLAVYKRQVYRRQNPISIFADVVVTRRIHDGDDLACVCKLHDGGGDGDASLLFDLHPVRGREFAVSARLDGSGLANRAAVQQEFFC